MSSATDCVVAQCEPDSTEDKDPDANVQYSITFRLFHDKDHQTQYVYSISAIRYYWQVFSTKYNHGQVVDEQELGRLKKTLLPQYWTVYFNNSNPYIGYGPDPKCDGSPEHPKNAYILCLLVDTIKDSEDRICMDIRAERKWIRIWFTWKD